jgi:hypothetical protein
MTTATTVSYTGNLNIDGVRRLSHRLGGTQSPTEHCAASPL